MISTTVKVNDKAVQKLFDKMIANGQNLRPVLRSIGRLGVESVKENFDAGGRPKRWKKSARAKKQGGQTLQDDGKLKGSITSRVGATKVAIGTTDIRADVHHSGKTIKPRSKKFLTIPTEFAKHKGSGKVKGTARDFEDTFIKKGKTGKGLWIFQNQPDGKILPIFKLVKRVKMPARPFMLLQKEDLTEIKKLLTKHIMRRK